MSARRAVRRLRSGPIGNDILDRISLPQRGPRLHAHDAAVLRLGRGEGPAEHSPGLGHLCAHSGGLAVTPWPRADSTAPGGWHGLQGSLAWGV